MKSIYFYYFFIFFIRYHDQSKPSMTELNTLCQGRFVTWTSQNFEVNTPDISQVRGALIILLNIL